MYYVNLVSNIRSRRGTGVLQIEGERVWLWCMSVILALWKAEPRGLQTQLAQFNDLVRLS